MFVHKDYLYVFILRNMSLDTKGTVGTKGTKGTVGTVGTVGTIDTVGTIGTIGTTSGTVGTTSGNPSGPFLLEKYKPETIYNFLFNQKILQKLLYTATNDNIPHIIISGPPGGGKKTLVGFFLSALYGPSVNDVSKCKYNVSGSSAKKEVEIIQSNHHIVIEPTNTNHDRYILQGIIKQYAKHRSFNFLSGDHKFKTIVIHNIENLAHNSQAALRRTMEKYVNTCRFVMICNNLSKIIDPLKSRCTTYCVPLPTENEIHTIVSYISAMEDIKLSLAETKNIVKKSDRSLKTALWLLDMKRFGIEGVGLNVFGTESTTMLDKIFDDIIGLIFRSMTVLAANFISEVFDKIRGHIYSILITNIEGSTIITTIMDKMLGLVKNDAISFEIIKITSTYEFNLVHGRRDITHIDTIIFQFIQICLKNADQLAHLKIPEVKKIVGKRPAQKKAGGTKKSA